MDILGYNSRLFENELREIDREIAERRKARPPRFWVDIIRRRKWKTRSKLTSSVI